MLRLVPRPILRTLASFTLALTLLGGCAYKNALERGDQAMTAQRYEEALSEYERALQLKPDSAEAKQKVAAARDKAVEVRVASARTKLAAKDLHGAVADAAAAVSLRAESPAVRSLVDEVIAAVTVDGERLTGAGLHAEAMSLFDAAIVGLPGDRSRLEAPRQATLTSWIAALDAGAKAAEAAGRKADALLQRAMMVELGDAAATADRDRLRDELRVVLAFRVRQAGAARDGGFAELAQRLTGTDPVRWIEVLAVGATTPEPTATLTFSLPKPRFNTDKSTRSESARYQSGTKQTPNPFYKMAQDKVRDRERAVLEAEKEVTNQERYVAQYTQDVAREGDTPNTSTGAEQNLSNAQSRLESARNRVNSERSQLQQARDDLGRTEQTKEEPVYSNVDYKITKHVLTASTRLTGTITSKAGAKQDIARDLVETATDETHDAQAQANIPENPLDLPPRETLEAQIREAAFTELTASIGLAFAAYRQSLLDAAKQATSDDDRADKLVRFMIVDSSASDPAIDETLWKLRGIPDATARLRRLTSGK
jgi:tetratricopeptide (TPR) repeat protein